MSDLRRTTEDHEKRIRAIELFIENLNQPQVSEPVGDLSEEEAPVDVNTEDLLRAIELTEKVLDNDLVAKDDSQTPTEQANEQAADPNRDNSNG